MIDHVLGRPSNQFRKVQVLLVVGFWSAYLLIGNKHGPPILRKLSSRLSARLTPWQTLLLTMLYLYTARNFAKLFNLECPEPLANLYSRSYFRATWVMTALDAGFWTAMPIRRKWLRDLAGPVFTVYYLIAAEQADEKVRKVRAVITLEHLRVSWNKSTTPILSALTRLVAPNPGVTPRYIKIARPHESAYRDPVDAVLYYTGTRAQLYQCKKVVLDFPGGGFIAMTPRHHDEKLCAWARQLGPSTPIISINYKKAPEFPYPYALNECYDVYHSIVYTNGQCVGLSGEVRPKIALVGDSAGGNFVVGVTLMILNTIGTNDRYREQQVQSLPIPDGLVLIYPSLDMNIGSWMSEEQMALIKRKTNRNVVKRKSEYFATTSGIRSQHASDDSSSEGEEEKEQKTLPSSKEGSIATANVTTATPASSKLTATVTEPPAAKPMTATIHTRLATTSRISYFNDRILTPEMMRAMVILYVGPHNRPDFTTDFLLSPIVAPDSLLALFPKCYFLTGERDPLVDDTVIFAGRLRRAKLDVWRHRKEMGLERGKTFDEKSHFEVSLIPGISHGFLQMGSLFPGAWREIDKCGRWLDDILSTSSSSRHPEEDDYFSSILSGNPDSQPTTPSIVRHHTRTRTTSMSEDDRPLEIGGRKRGKGFGMKSTGASNVVGRAKLKDRSKSEMSLGSEDDLVGRRMQGLAGSLGVTSGGDA